FSGMLFPRLCPACQTNLPPKNDLICLPCSVKLPKTGHHLKAENEFTRRFWGRVPLQAGAARYYFTKKSRTQNLLHQLKYHGQKQIGEVIGEQYGAELAQSPFFRDVEVIVPVPLHWKKERHRGYNQSYHFALGLARALRLPVLKNGLARTRFGASQTRKSKTERFQNALSDFLVAQPQWLIGKHCLLVDDVLTTGATLEGCATQLLALPNTKVSAVTIAMARS
ncbi:MAG: ComF family protein, partial [Bacteroidetes bacterium]